MNRFGIRPEKGSALEAKFRELGIAESDIDETFVRSSGPGGQNVNKRSTCVVLLHRPTGIQVKVQQERSQALNRFLARRLLAGRIEARIRGVQSEAPQRREKIRRQKRRRSRRAKEKMLRNKHHRSEVKQLRRSPEASE